MPTKTKPKRPPDFYRIPVTLKPADKALLAELCGFDGATDPDGSKARQLVAGLESLLTLEFNRLRRIPLRPLAAHVVAALQPISKASKELAAMVHPSSLSVEVGSALQVWEAIDGRLWELLTNTHVAADVAITRLKAEQGRGQHKRLLKEATDLTRELLTNLFRSSAVDPVAGDEAEFLKVCCAYLPRPPRKPRYQDG